MRRVLLGALLALGFSHTGHTADGPLSQPVKREWPEHGTWRVAYSAAHDTKACFVINEAPQNTHIISLFYSERRDLILQIADVNAPQGYNGPISLIVDQAQFDTKSILRIVGTQGHIMTMGELKIDPEGDPGEVLTDLMLADMVVVRTEKLNYMLPTEGLPDAVRDFVHCLKQSFPKGAAPAPAGEPTR